MYLKSIEIYGFKSFAKKMKFEFHNGITGIVGPNGSGKSNVADAVRWVLGEQSAKQLRGSSMQDIIFAGTEARSPLSYAYVALTMDNSDHVLPIDYEEVTIARRVYRSGESEYLLNGAPCRLKDVAELFYDTGVGKEGYSIIGQGQIEKILSGKPEDRRELFDEAVGIVKYKKRKAASVKKLESERENLVRVNDILSEQERRIGPLEKQSEDAKKYLKFKEDLKKIDVNAFLLEVDRLQNNLDDVEKNSKIASQQLEESKNAQEEIRVKYDALEQEITELDEKIESLKQEQSDSTLLKGKLENEIALLEEQIRSANASEEQQANRIAEIEADKAEKEKQLTEFNIEKESFDKTLDEAVERLNSVKSSYSELQNAILVNNEKIDADNKAIMELLNNRASIKSKEQRLETMLEQTNIRKAKLTQRLLERKTREEDLDVAVALAEEDFKNAQSLLLELQDKDKEFSAKAVEWKEKSKKNFESLQAKKDEFARVQTRLESIKNIAERYEGYGNSTRKVMEQKGRIDGIEGVVSDLIHVEKKYEMAIETALGGNIQNIVTKDEACAKKLISFLKENKLGRATFLPLTSVDGRGNFKKTEVLDEKGVLGLASELVSCDSKFDGVVAYLLGRVVVTDNIDSAIALAKKNNYSIHIVTVDGEYLAPGGSMTGGHFKNKSNLLGRNREIEELEEKLDVLSKEMDELKNRAAEIETAAALLDSDREDNTSKLNEAAIALNTAKLGLDRANEQKKESLTAYEGLAKESEELEAQLTEITAGKKEIEFEKQESESKEAELQAEIQKLSDEVDEKTYMETSVNRTMSEVLIEEANARSNVDFVQQNINRVTAEIEKCLSDIESIKENAASSKEETEAKQNRIEEIKSTIAASDDSFGKLESDIKENIAKRDALNNSHKNFFEQRQEISDRISELDKECYRLGAQIEKINDAISYQNNYMWNEYELTYHNAEELKDPEFNDLDQMKKDANKIKNSIRAMGNVNVNAIEEYKELSERYNFLKGQHDDLVEAEASLVRIIEELDEGMRKQFTEGFKDIQVQFDKAFKELFGGGHGSLALVDEEDILETGIIINAQPPGKKLINMMQMSGGEKSLTAIALLFAIQNLKPSPFCLLDEIEAALDDANVDRFANYLHKLTKNTQFIVITHRRGTMNAADRLFGITMQEKGVSTLVSVNLIESQLDD
ncbi:chromosome segregation protein SMC [Pseudobutyrivibrio xylanivorans]|uniref:Chromosome partition protein Smc n=1 Tax=Pseudobutyrivibrio xylanivorans TaxID=185007 RepID=A0A5P6VS56_PSEXY|nr:chromosome segregation protein SMC [Pseudobutyrivibrio xylanivorans]QFJ55535.1 chromosome segregation protein SMC [Pseudobutyrivibrio xylanivorans]